MTTDNSPTYALGRADGAADARRISQCPSQPELGPTPPNPAYPVMYNRGYDEEFSKAVRHICTDRCKQ